jgi:very-short-patch-repair endonuclease
LRGEDCDEGGIPNVTTMAKRITSSQQIKFARNLRHQQSDAERLLWSKLRGSQLNGVKFRRQHSVGNYVVDFVCLRKKLIIEIDGSQHNEECEKVKDARRTRWLQGEGYRVLRFWNNDVLTNIDGVFLTILESLK